MAYCTEAQVAIEAKVTAFSTSTTPKAADVTRIITEVDAEINGMVGTKYNVPISDASDVLVMQAISIALTVERVRSIMEVSTGDSKVEQGKGGRATAADLARKKLEAIVDGKLKLLGSTLATAGDGVKASGRTTTQCVFKVGEDQW